MLIHGSRRPGAMYALSLKQPWAALVLHGVKTIEIRKWPTSIRGPILLHAAKVDDERPEGWQLLPVGAKPSAELRGGVIGEVELLECRRYCSQTEFDADSESHRNLLQWFEPPRMFGFVFRNPKPIAFHSWPANVRFFTIPLADLEKRSSKTSAKKRRRT